MTKSLKKDVINDSLLSLANSAAAILKPFALVYLVNNYLGTDAYGQVAVFLSSIALISLFSSLGVGFSMRRHISGEADINKKKRLFYSPINFQLTLLILYALIAYCYVSLGNVNISVTELSIYSFYYLSFILFQYFLEYFRWTLNSKKFVKFSVLYAIIFLIFLYAAFVFQLVENVYQILVIDALIMFLIMLHLFRTAYKELGFFFGTFDKRGFFKEFKLGMPYALGGLSEITIATADRFMIVFFFGLVEAGLYSSGYFFGSLSLIIVRLIGLFTPQYMFLARDSEDKGGVNDLINYSFFAFFVVAIPYVFFLILFGSEILSMISISSDRAYFSMIVISIASIFSGSYLILSSVTIMEKKTSVQMQLMLGFSLFNVVSNYLLIMLFKSFVVASVVTLVTYCLIVLLFIRYLNKIWRFEFPTKFILTPLILALISYGCVNVFELTFLTYFKSIVLLEGFIFVILYLIGLIFWLEYSKMFSFRKLFGLG